MPRVFCDYLLIFDFPIRASRVRIVARPTFTLTRRVEFRETDAAGLMPFSNFYRWMEVCEHEWLRALGREIMSAGADGFLRGWPPRESSCSPLRPLRGGDVVRIRAAVEENGDNALAYAFVFDKDRAGRWTEVAQRKMTMVHVSGRMEPEPMPAAVGPPSILPDHWSEMWPPIGAL